MDVSDRKGYGRLSDSDQRTDDALPAAPEQHRRPLFHLVWLEEHPPHSADVATPTQDQALGLPTGGRVYSGRTDIAAQRDTGAADCLGPADRNTRAQTIATGVAASDASRCS